MERKYKMFRETRNALIKSVDQQAKESASAASKKDSGPKGMPSCHYPERVV